jgi:hypothetical protein
LWVLAFRAYVQLWYCIGGAASAGNALPPMKWMNDEALC